MTDSPCTIERLMPPVQDSDARTLAQLLVDTVASGEAVSFLAPLTLEQAEGLQPREDRDGWPAPPVYSASSFPLALLQGSSHERIADLGPA